MLYADGLLFILTLALVLFGGKKFAELAEALARDFRGGPRPPSHPLPADDSRILNRRRRPSTDA
jgi:mttA/Hcf106 family